MRGAAPPLDSCDYFTGAGGHSENGNLIFPQLWPRGKDWLQCPLPTGIPYLAQGKAQIKFWLSSP